MSFVPETSWWTNDVRLIWSSGTSASLFYGLLTWLPFVIVLLAQALQDPGVYGVIQSGDHKARTCVVKWVKLNSSSDDVEVSHPNLKNPDLKNHPLSSALCHLPRPGSGHRGGR